MNIKWYTEINAADFYLTIKMRNSTRALPLPARGDVKFSYTKPYIK